jgi:dGTPase
MSTEENEYWTERRSPVESDGRSPYERDFARLVHSASFRRLQAKTQVLGLGDSDFYRTRLTHSMEVSQIGEAIARKLKREACKGTPSYKILPDPMLVRTVCLAHDLGHPPFGHGGEVALNRCMLKHGGFEGNGQTLRIMAKLEPYHKEHGMNLTRRTLLGVLKYPASYAEVVNEKKYPKPKSAQRVGSVFKAGPFKPPKCYLDTEQDVVNWIGSGELKEDWHSLRSSLIKKHGDHKKTEFKALDTSIMELGDDIAYGVHDLEDALSLKLISQRQFLCSLPSDKFKFYLCTNPRLTYDNLVENLFSEDTTRRKTQIGRLVGYFVNNISLKTGFGYFKHPILNINAVMDNDAATVLKSLEDFILEDVIKSTPVQQLEFKGQKIITELFDAFTTDPKRLLMKRDLDRSELGCGSTPIERVVCDYIAGMTDEYATKRYQQLFAPRVGSVFDRL